jgi:hypothetical protein
MRGVSLPRGIVWKYEMSTLSIYQSVKTKKEENVFFLGGGSLGGYALAVDVDEWFGEFGEDGNDINHKPITRNSRPINLQRPPLPIHPQNLCKPIQHSPSPLLPRPHNSMHQRIQLALVLPESFLDGGTHGAFVLGSHVFCVGEEGLWGGEWGEGKEGA